MSIEKFHKEVSQKERFEFGKNWKKFLLKLDNERIEIAQKSLLEMLELETLQDKSFLDIGSGSGLSSLAAKNAGAAKITSFDFDDNSVWCTKQLKTRYFPNCKHWHIMQGSVLDTPFLNTLDPHHIVYSWGVLHHTGQMWLAIDNATKLVAKNGLLFIAIYNNQGAKSHLWWLIKCLYNRLPSFLQKPFAYTLGFAVKFLILIKYTLKLQPKIALDTIFNYKQTRGMSMLSDMIDWYGGLPFEFATYDHLIQYIQNKGFKLTKGKPTKSLGCHQLVFKKINPPAP